MTIGINQVTWRTLLDRAVAQAMDDVDADAHLPAGYLDDPDLLADRAGRAAALARRGAGRDRCAQVADDQTRPFLEKRGAHLRGSMVDRMHLDARRRRHPAAPPARASPACCGPTATGCTCSSVTGG